MPRQADAQPAAAKESQCGTWRHRLRDMTEYAERGQNDADEGDQRGDRGLKPHAGMVAGRTYTPDVPRWLAVGLGCLTALGMQALFGLAVSQTPAGAAIFVGYVALFAALVLAGFVTGHLVGRFQLVYGSIVAIVFILLTATVEATREAIVARELGVGALPPLDFVQLTLKDVLAMTGATFGGWLASRF